VKTLSHALCADLVLLNGKVLTVDPSNSIAEAVAIKGNKIVNVGSRKKVEPMIGPETSIIDLDGKTLMPGIIDSHVHAVGAGRLKLMEREYVDIKYADSIEEVLEKIGERAEETPRGAWMIGWGYMWTRFRERRVPLARELDSVAPDHPVLLVFSAYGAANTMAMRVAGVTKDSKPEYGEVELDPGTGEPTGVLKGGAAVRLVRNHVPPLDLTPYDAIVLACGQFSEWGITTIHEAGARGEANEAFQRLLKEGKLNVRVRLYIDNIAPNLDTHEHVLALGLRRGFGDDMLRLSGIKFALDSMGTMGTAATYEPCTGNPGSLGILLMEPDTMRDLIVKAHRAGLQTATHSIGNRAIDINLDAIEAALSERPDQDHRHRIEHCTHCGPEQLERIMELGVIPAESNYVWNFGDAYKYQFGPERSKWLYPYNSFREHGIIASSNSDYGGGPWHGNPILGIYAIVTRRTEGGDTIGLNQAVDVVEAIRTYKINGAYAGFDEDRLGSIEEGKLADMIVLSDDITSVEPEEIKDIKVLTTIVDGKIVYQRDSS
jgi:predicted amidohydrolase YtcJ